MVLAVIAVLAGGLFHALLRYEELAEKTAVDMTIRNLRSGLRWQIAERLLRGSPTETAALVGANPIGWLERPPDGYIGEHAGPSADLPRGSWYFDTDSRELAYRPNLTLHFEAPAGRSDEIRWRVIARRRGNLVLSAEGLTLDETTQYRWF